MQVRYRKFFISVHYFRKRRPQVVCLKMVKLITNRKNIDTVNKACINGISNFISINCTSISIGLLFSNSLATSMSLAPFVCSTGRWFLLRQVVHCFQGSSRARRAIERSGRTGWGRMLEEHILLMCG